jgi:uncharacterized membrane protein YeaQ/YmgE (transglycosylase-associated protein family)
VIILAFIVIALVAGSVANFVWGKGRGYLPWELFVVGIVGSFVGGLIFSLVAGEGLEIRTTGLIGSILGALVVLPIYGWLRPRLAAR